jgi:repressor LexA
MCPSGGFQKPISALFAKHSREVYFECMATLTPKQRLFYGHLVSYLRDKGQVPTIRELRDLAGFKSTRTVIQYLNALEAAGVVTRGDGPRNVRLAFSAAAPAGTVKVPVIGHVAAGQPILAEQNVVDEIPVSRTIARGEHRYFFLEVHGDSMDRAGIQDGNFVLVRQQETASPNEIVVALLDDSATIKRLRLGDAAAVLQPVSSNPIHKPIIVDHDFRIQGVVVATFQREELFAQ